MFHQFVRVVGLSGLLVSVVALEGARDASAAIQIVNSQQVPLCLDAKGQQQVPVNDQQVIFWKTNTPNTYLNRGHVTGVISELYPNQNDHVHFAVQIGPQPGDVIELIYNIEFGAMPQPQVGMRVEACGDYITSSAQSGPYPPSPDGAILHWVHMAPPGENHPSGFVIIAGYLFGQDLPNAQAPRTGQYR